VERRNQESYTQPQTTLTPALRYTKPLNTLIAYN